MNIKHTNKNENFQFENIYVMEKSSAVLCKDKEISHLTWRFFPLSKLGFNKFKNLLGFLSFILMPSLLGLAEFRPLRTLDRSQCRDLCQSHSAWHDADYACGSTSLRYRLLLVQYKTFECSDCSGVWQKMTSVQSRA